jgi:hypothetical protein
MEKGKAVLPLVVTSPSGLSGVSAPFSIIPEDVAKQTEALGQAAVLLMTCPPGLKKEAADNFGTHLESVASSLDRMYLAANSSGLSVASTLTEAVRSNMEHTLRFIEDLVATSPCDAFGLQVKYLSEQTKLHAEQSSDLARELIKLFFWR